MAIDTTLVTVCGQLRTLRAHVKYKTAPAMPATMFQGYTLYDINVYMQRKQAVPAHCSILLSIYCHYFHVRYNIV